MTIDLSEFHDVFFEECFEGLDIMESGLLTLDQTTDVDDINAIFRAAHSIKGGGASFGFMEISGFTHVMETLLDEMRDGSREITRKSIDLLLESVDILRDMVNAARDEEENNQQAVAQVRQKLDAMLANNADSESSAETSNDGGNENSNAVNESNPEAITAETPVQDSNTDSKWDIHFYPHKTILQGGNDPVRILRELEALGELQIEVDTSGVPALHKMNPEHCYLGWNLQLSGDIGEADIEELFSWVVDESDLEITQQDIVHAAPEKIVPETIIESSTVTEISPVKLVEEQPSAVSSDSTPAEGTTTTPAQAEVKKEKKKKTGSGAAKESGSIRVAIDKIDELINLVGELVITQSMLSQTGSDMVNIDADHVENLRDGLVQLERNTRELQESVLQIRMLPISFSFSRFPRLVRDLSSKMGKQIELTMTGENTEVDKTVLEKIGDPLVHLVRNSLDHGIETPDIRLAAGKPETGKIELCAYHEGGDIIIKVIDDGAGLNRDRILSKAIEKGLLTENDSPTDERIYNLIFAAGFSTAEQVSDVSGRGVGMDVVRRNVRDLGGNVSINSNEGAGSTVTIRLPLTLAILDGQLTRVGDETYIVSMVSIIESLQMKPDCISRVTGQSELYLLREEYIPIIRLGDLLGIKTVARELEKGLLMVVETDGQQFGLFVDELMGQQQVVIKSIETNFTNIQGISGATILGDGTVALIIDVPGLIDRYFEQCNKLTEVA